MVLTRFRVGIEFPYKEAGKIKRYILPALFIFAQTRVRTPLRGSDFQAVKIKTCLSIQDTDL